MTDSFVHLHLHTEYSMLDGASRIDDVVSAAVRDGMPAVGITDHGNMYGVLPLFAAAREQGVKPVLGMEGYFTNGSRFDRPRRAEHEIYHLTMLAENDLGYHNLMKVASQAYLDGYYYKPRTDWDLLERHHEGIIATTGCLGGLVSQLLLAGELDAAYKAAGRFQDIFGPTTSSWSCRTTASTNRSRRLVRCSTSRSGSARRCSPPTTPTTPTSTTPRRTTPCCAYRPER